LEVFLFSISKPSFNKVKNNFNFIKIYITFTKTKNMKLPIVCPSCDHTLNVSQMKCPSCKTEVSGDYELPVILKLNRDEQDFILNFFLSSGSIKEMAKQAELSYPTMRNKMDDLIQKIIKLNNA
jgi:hypothetical protein